MAYCAAVGCSNYKKKNKDLTFFSIPKDKAIVGEWKAKIKRQDLPQLVFLCENHFEDSCFDESVELQNRLLGEIYFYYTLFASLYVIYFITTK